MFVALYRKHPGGAWLRVAVAETDELMDAIEEAEKAGSFHLHEYRRFYSASREALGPVSDGEGLPLDDTSTLASTGASSPA